MIASREHLDSLAEQIRIGIADRGCYVLLKDDLEIFWPGDNIVTRDEKRKVVEDFANGSGFDLTLTKDLMMAVFRGRMDVTSLFGIEYLNSRSTWQTSNT